MSGEVPTGGGEPERGRRKKVFNGTKVSFIGSKGCSAMFWGLSVLGENKCHVRVSADHCSARANVPWVGYLPSVYASERGIILYILLPLVPKTLTTATCPDCAIEIAEYVRKPIEQ